VFGGGEGIVVRRTSASTQSLKNSFPVPLDRVPKSAENEFFSDCVEAERERERRKWGE
jgi:hypothetical protein